MPRSTIKMTVAMHDGEDTFVALRVPNDGLRKLVNGMLDGFVAAGTLVNPERLQYDCSVHGSEIILVLPAASADHEAQIAHMVKECDGKIGILLSRIDVLDYAEIAADMAQIRSTSR